MRRAAERRPARRGAITTTPWRSWWPRGWGRRRGRSRRSGCCRPLVRRGMGARRGTSAAWSPSARLWRDEHRRGRRPGVWAPGEYLVIDWGDEGGLHVFCAVLAWSRFRFVRFAADERSETTLALLAECFETLGGVPGKVLADRMGCLKGGVVANVVVPTAEYVRFAGHYGFRPDFCEARDPQSKGIVENLVGYAKAGLMVLQAPFGDLTAANAAARAWCAEVNGAVHSEICAVPDRKSTRLNSSHGSI